MFNLFFLILLDMLLRPRLQKFCKSNTAAILHALSASAAEIMQGRTSTAAEIL